MSKNIFFTSLRFLSVGAITTSVSLLSNVLLLKYAHTPLVPTYIMVYCSTIGLSFFLNSTFTFKSKKSLRNIYTYVAIYLCTLSLGVALNTILPAMTNFPNWYYPFFVIPVTGTINFCFSNKLLHRNEVKIDGE